MKKTFILLLLIGLISSYKTASANILGQVIVQTFADAIVNIINCKNNPNLKDCLKSSKKSNKKVNKDD